MELFEKRGKSYLRCLATNRDRRAKPEEIVRQLYLRRLIEDLGYSTSRLRIEKPVVFGSSVHKKRADIAIMDADDPEAVFAVVECKKPKRTNGIGQLKSYCNAEGCPLGVWTNGGQHVVLHRQEPNFYREVGELPRADQTLSDVLNVRWTLSDLTKRNKLVVEQTTLKDIILDMENLVLANAGVDAFEEVFKLVYAKLYDEWHASQGKRNYLDFMVGGRTPSEYYARIQHLFDEAKTKWPGVFLSDEKIDLTPTHLVTCGSFLQDVKLFNSNLQVIDDAFEYLSTQVGKGRKGQYFTPRYVIDMCVKMLNPRIDEFIVDTAAGSCGFTVHSIFHVWGNEFRADGPEPWQAEYAREKVYAFDFDARSIKIAKAVNLIAGDGRTNVYRANSLDPRSWTDEARVGLRHRLQRLDDPKMDRWNQQNYRFFDFDVVLTNPPFSGAIKDSRTLHQFDLAKKSDGEWRKEASRDVLFIERNLEFLRPGGRMAIVLPDGRLNNISDQYIRSFVGARARILASVSLPMETFKPHTNTKTSVLFLQKWDTDGRPGNQFEDDHDYPIFFGISELPGKDSTGEYNFVEGPEGVAIQDEHGHFVVRHDLDEIADAFRTWGRRQGFEFCREDG